ncbi:meiosis-specific kinetochore protein isoform X2 [Notechis scutatus]|uniref:Meiosis-specific kinetochore protein isoform X2 n=1 Tax=Notechis scutatus TaxID=8663 RepID=A0A6J1VRL3_9SAUR|nr:meiosis-specific kinetochore protein isoform X2 [Notechis scutatus]
MDWMKLRSYSGNRHMQKKTYCASPLPSKTASVAMVRMKSKAKASQEHPDLLSKFSCDPQVKSTIGKKKEKIKSTVTEALPKIQEYSEVTQMVCFSSEERIELNCNEYRSTNSINDMETTPLKDSLHLASASAQSLRYSEATSEMTLPTGVSDFLLDCLDMETTLDCSYTKTIDSTSSYSSPEIFRDETELEDTASPETHLACKNSTLLDTSKAINLDKMSQLPNFSKILGTPLGIQGQNIARKQSREKLPSEPTNTSAVIAGKQVCKILSANEKRLKSQPSGVSLLLPERKKKTEDQIPVKRKCRKKITFENECSISSPHGSPSPGKNSSKEMCGILASRPPNADMLDLLSAHEASVQDNCLAYKECPNVNSEAIVPLFPRKTIYQNLHSPPEICCIIQASPGFRPLKVVQHSTKKKKGFLPPEATEGKRKRKKIL